MEFINANVNTIKTKGRKSSVGLTNGIPEIEKGRKSPMRLLTVDIPEIEIEERTNSVLAQAEDRVKSLEDKLRQKEAREELQKRRDAIVRKGLVDSEDDVKEVEKIMVEKGIANHETAAEYHSWMKQMSAPTPSQFPQPVMSKFNTKDFMKNPVGAARDAAHAALNEFRKNPKPIGL